MSVSEGVDPDSVKDGARHYATAPRDRISFAHKLTYEAGAFVNNLLAAAIGGMLIVLNLGLGMNPALVGLVALHVILIGAVPVDQHRPYGQTRFEKGQRLRVEMRAANERGQFALGTAPRTQLAPFSARRKGVARLRGDAAL